MALPLLKILSKLFVKLFVKLFSRASVRHDAAHAFNAAVDAVTGHLRADAFGRACEVCIKRIAVGSVANLEHTELGVQRCFVGDEDEGGCAQ